MGGMINLIMVERFGLNGVQYWCGRLRRLLLFLVGIIVSSGMLWADSPTHAVPDPEPGGDGCGGGDNGEADCEKCPKPDEGGGREDCPRKGDPFYLHTGEFYLEKTFMSAGSEAPGLHFTVRYSSFSEANDVLGLGWVYNYRMQVYERSDGNIVVRKSNGDRHIFIPEGGGVYKLEGGRYGELTVLGGGGYLLKSSRDKEFEFDSEGRLTKALEGNGSEVRLSYDPVGEVAGDGGGRRQQRDDTDGGSAGLAGH